jgi:two-component system, NarL family, nitrate/nitrite response regulator NarL
MGGPNRKTVLIVEEQALISFGLSHELGKRGVHSLVFPQPRHEEILATARRDRPVLAILGLHFGRAAAAPRLISPLRQVGVPSVILTGVTDLPVLGTCLELGAVGVVSKCESFDTVLEQIDAALNADPMHSSREREALLAAARRRRATEERRLHQFQALSDREVEVLAYLMDGLCAEAIASRTFVSTATVRTYIQSILRKLGVKSQVAAVAKAHAAGWEPSRVMVA